jgi:hypothetical protein
MKEYYADLELTNEIESWILLQGGTASTSNSMLEYDKKLGRFINNKVDVFFGHRKIHFYAGTNQVRMFFNEENAPAALILFLKWPEAIIKHNFPKNIYDKIY